MVRGSWGGFVYNLLSGPESAYFPQVGAFVVRAPAPGTALTFIVEDPAAVGIFAYFEALASMFRQQVSERGGNFCHHPAPIPGQWDHLQLKLLTAPYQATD